MAIVTELDEVTPDLLRIRTLFVNLYLLGTRDSWVLVDAGFSLPGVAGIVLRAAEARFGQAAQPAAIILTHGHFDHVGALPELLERWDAPVLAHHDELPHLTGRADYPPPDPHVGRGLMAVASALYPYKAIDLGDRVRLLPGEADHSEGSVPGAEGWRWLHTPGHTRGHVSLFRDADRCLIAGDAFVTTRQESLYAVATQEEAVRGPPAYFTPDWASAQRSVERLAALEPEIAATGHGRVMRGEALRAGLARLVDEFDVIAMPDRERRRRRMA